MAKKIQIDIEVNGKMQKATVSAKKLRNALNEVEGAENRAAQGARNADRNLKGLSAQSANGTKNFSKMAQGMSGFLVPAYATLAANVFALSAAFNFLKSAGDLRALQAGQESYARQTGTSMVMLTKNIQAATGGLVAYQEAAQAAAIGNAAGLTADQLTRLGAIAKNAGTILGRDVTDAFNRLTRGAIKAEPELLDELGIIVRLADASQRYADALDINVNSLTTFQKSQAVVNATIAEGESKFDDVGESINNVARLQASLADTFKTVKEAIAGVANFIAGALNDSIYALIASLGLLGTSFLRAIVPSGPALMNVAEGASRARQNIINGIDKKTATGKAVKKGDFGPRTMYNLERSAKAAQSSIRNESKLTQMQMQRDLRLIRADMILTSAQGKGAFSKMFANWRAQLLLFQAEHGRVMGTVKAVTAAAATAMSTVLSFAAWIGMAIILVSFIKKGLDYFKDPALKRVEEVAQNARDGFDESTESIKKLRNELDTARSSMEGLVQQANLLANFTWSNFNSALNNLRTTAKEFNLDGIDLSAIDQDAIKSLNKVKIELQNIKETGTKDGILPEEGFITRFFNNIGRRSRQTNTLISTGLEENIEELDTQVNTILDGVDVSGLQERVLPIIRDTIPAALDNLELQFDILSEAGRDTSGLEETAQKVKDLSAQLMSGKLSSTEYVQILMELVGPSGVLQQLKADTQAVTSDVLAQRNAFKALSQTLEAFRESSKTVRLKDSPYTQLLGQLESAEQSLATLTNVGTGESVFKAFTGDDDKFKDGVAQYQALLQLAGLEDDATSRALTNAEFRAVLEERTNKLREIAVTMEVKKYSLELANLKALRQATPLQAKQVKLDMAVLKARQALNKLIAEKEQMEMTGRQMSPEQLRIYTAQKAVLQEQLEIAKEQAQVFEQLAQTTRNAFESGLSSGINDFITNKEGSLKDGIKTLAKGVLESISQEIANNLARSVSDFLFGKKDPAADMKAAMVAGGNSASSATKTSIETAGAKAAQDMKTAITQGGTAAAQALSAAMTGKSVADPSLDTSGFSEVNTINPKYLKNQGAAANPLGDLTFGPSLDQLQNRNSILGNQSGLAVNGPLSQVGSMFGVGSVEDDMIRSSFGGAGSGRTLTLGEDEGGGLSDAMASLRDSIGELTIETTSNITAGAALLAGLTGNSKAAETLAKITAALKAYQMIRTGIEKFLGVKRTTETGMLITALAANTASNYAAAASGAAGGMLPGFRYGGVAKPYSTGGIANGPNSGHLAMLHGKEAIVPLPNGNSIPVEMKNSGQGVNNVTVNVSTDGQTQSSSNGQDASNLGQVIAAAVQKELHNQKRAGGILNKHGAA